MAKKAMIASILELMKIVMNSTAFIYCFIGNVIVTLLSWPILSMIWLLELPIIRFMFYLVPVYIAIWSLTIPLTVIE